MPYYIEVSAMTPLARRKQYQRPVVFVPPAPRKGRGGGHTKTQGALFLEYGNG